MIRPPVPAPTFEALAETYEAAIGPRTRLVLLTHPSNLTGQLLPVRRIAVAAHRVGAEVVVDGAQSFGVVDDPITSFDCDYYGASAHKWLGAPVGVGILWGGVSISFDNPRGIAGPQRQVPFRCGIGQSVAAN